MLRLKDLKIKVEVAEDGILPLISQKLKIQSKEITNFKIIKRSTDARINDQIYFIYTVDVTVKNEANLLKRHKWVEKAPKVSYELPLPGDKLLEHRPVVVGFGPSGMFSALLLAEMGLKPIVFERGSEVTKRVKDVTEFWENGKLNPESNIQFGEGGAGTFSDGKLTTRIKDIRSRKVLEEFVTHGATSDILSVHNPHIGTDVLVTVVKNMREKIKQLGGEIHFNHKLEKLEETQGIINLTVNGKLFQTKDIVLAIGHSARDTFTWLYEQGVQIDQKAFAVGLRIEHPQVIINQAQFGKKYMNFPKLGAAEYKLTHKASNGRSVYTFCMCPGGTVVAASSEYDTVVTNGMSEYNRDQKNANSALVCSVDHSDFELKHPLAGMEFQRELERQAFILGGSSYYAPVQRVKDFLNSQVSADLGSVTPSYPIGHTYADLNQLFPETIQTALKEAIVSMNKKLHGFSLDDAILTGVETRTSSPIRIVRDSLTLESVNTRGLYPTGEGAGYAGGIMSAAIDGLRVAEAIIKKYKVWKKEVKRCTKNIE